MKKEDFQDLAVGDIVKHKNGRAYLITGDFGDRKTAVHTADITNPSEWELVFKAKYEEHRKLRNVILPIKL